MAYRLMYVGRSSSAIERRYGRRLSRLVGEGFEVHVLAADDGGLAALAQRGVVVEPIPVDRRLNVAGLVGAYFIIQAYFIEKSPILVHAFDDVLAWVGAFAAHRAHTPVVVATVERHALIEGPSGVRWRRMLAGLSGAIDGLESVVDVVAGTQIRRGLAGAYRYLGGLVDKYFVVNEYDFDALQQRRLVAPAKLEMIVGADGVALDQFDIDDDDFPSVEAARRILGIDGQWRGVVGYRGSLESASAAGDLLACIERTSQTHPSAGWLIGLDGRPDGRLGDRLARHERAGRVAVIRDVDDLGIFYRALDALVCPDRGHGAASRLMEAAAAGVGAVAYHLPATATAVEHGQTGQLVDRGDLDGLVAAVDALLADPGRLEQFGARARALAVRKFDRRQVDDQVLRIYDSVLESTLSGLQVDSPTETPP